MIRKIVVAVLLLIPAIFAQDFSGVAHAFLPQGSAPNAREEALYKQGTDALNASNWQPAVQAFGEAADLRGRRADAALYWKAYALNKLARRAEASATLGELRRQYPHTSWLKDAGALDLEIRQANGQRVNPGAQEDDELKLLAINSLMNSDPERAVPLLQGILQSNNSVKVKERALFVLAQNDSPKAQEIITAVARGNSGPDLQVRAIRYLGLSDSPKHAAALAELFKSATDLKVKHAVLQAYMTSDNKAGVLAAAREERDPEVRAYAIRQLGPMGATKELQQLYPSLTTLGEKEAVLQAMGVAGDALALAQIARTAAEPEIRIRALRALGIIDKPEARAPLLEVYNNDKNREVRRAAIEGLFVQDDAADLVALARKESDPEMKKHLVQQLSVMDNKQARDYMLELLNK